MTLNNGLDKDARKMRPRPCQPGLYNDENIGLMTRKMDRNLFLPGDYFTVGGSNGI
jgi:hypothetical protein